MHILLLYPVSPRLTYGFMPAPYGLETLRAHLDSSAFEISIVNPFLRVDPEASVEEAIRPETGLIGISVRNLDDALTVWDLRQAEGKIQTESSLDDLQNVMAWCRARRSDIPIVLGGAAFSHMPCELLEFLAADAGIIGAAEQEFVTLSEGLRVGKSLAQMVREIPRLLSLGSAYKKAVQRGAPTGERIRVPVTWRERHYFSFKPEAAVRTFSGCPLRCAHCIEHVGTRVIERTATATVVQEMTEVRSRYPEVRRFFLADSEVNLAGEPRTLALIDAIRGEQSLTDIPVAGYFNPRPLSPPFLDRLAQARVDLRVTIDHVVDSILLRNGKNFCSSDLQRMVDAFASAGLELSFCLLLGQPGETRASVDEVIRFVENIPDAVCGPIYFSPGVRIYPGTPIAEGLRSGSLDRRWLVGDQNDNHSFLKPLVYCESWDPFELFEYVIDRGGGRIQPMNRYLHGLCISERKQMENDFRAYHVGFAEVERDQQTAWAQLSQVRWKSAFMNNAQRTDLLWIRGRLALEIGKTMSAINDWEQLKALIEPRAQADPAIKKLEHNLHVAKMILTSGYQPH